MRRRKEYEIRLVRGRQLLNGQPIAALVDKVDRVIQVTDCDSHERLTRLVYQACREAMEEEGVTDAS